MKSNYFVPAVIALLISVGSIITYDWIKSEYDKPVIKVEHVNNTPSQAALFTKNENGEVIPLDFTEVAAEVMDAVVHIKSTQTAAPSNNPFGDQNVPNPFDDFFRDFFDPRFDQGAPSEPRARVGAGSGVIINEKGYIVTNNHVIADASDIEVTLHDNRSYKATVIGTDPTTDLALIKIDEVGLIHIPFIDSETVKVGQWVIAVGNPFNLTSTVTAGIVSAKGRSINILREQFAVESFIQTDAAINPGNSGGALVDLQGNLIGINTAIASPTGSYSGYGFAVPSNIVSKVIEDLMEYGNVQRGVLGILIRNIDANVRNEYDLEVNQGALVDSILANSAAAEAGLQSGDVIIEVNGLSVDNSSRLQEIIAQYRPGDEVGVKVDRNGREAFFNVVLNNRSGGTEIAAAENTALKRSLGAELSTLSKDDAKELNIDGGVKVNRLYPGKLRQSQVREGFIITKVNGTKVKDVETFNEVIDKIDGGVMLEGIYEGVQGKQYYAFGKDSN